MTTVESALYASLNCQRTKPEPSCVCQEKGPVCGSDGWTHPNICQLREAASCSNTTLKLSGRGACYSSYCTFLFQISSFQES
uniref:Kazal-like domain-containing protein n=1 Tax=Amphilophus citrinellus TaxID=61819 RepID=A0A3Q0T4N3_AMPCI